MNRKQWLDQQIGKQFGRLTVLAAVKSQMKKGPWMKTLARVRCQCGTETTVAPSNLRKGLTQSCGCMQREIATRANTKHRHCDKPEFHIWYQMIRRCTQSDHPEFGNYGGRGITVCERWLEFENFYVDMGDKPADHSLDRRNNDGHYEPSNCRWATGVQQCNNTRRNVFLESNGERLTITQWSRRTGIAPATIRARIEAGHAAEIALSQATFKGRRFDLQTTKGKLL